MKINARVSNGQGRHDITLRTNDAVHSLQVAPKSTGQGSSVNGGELLFLALATCYCNDLYREAEKMSIPVSSVDVEVEGDFGQEGEPADNVRYSVKVVSSAPGTDVEALVRNTDTVAEIQNTLRRATPVTLAHVEVRSL